MSILQIVDLKKDYGEEPNITHALNGIQFEVDKGEFVGIMGASGSGKTTLLNCISTIDTATNGHIYLDGKDILEIKEKAAAYGIGIVSPEVIDSINILQATYEAMRQAVAQLPQEPDIFLNDAVIIPGISEEKQIKIIKGDAKSVSIAAASILAKVTRDHMMMEYDKIYPEYGFAKHKGYGTPAHITALKEFGPTPIHRRSFIGHFV